MLGEVLAAVVCRTPPTLVLPAITGGHGTLNMLIAVTGRSGAGKGSAAAVARDALDFEETLLLRPDRVPLGSGEGLAKNFGSTRKDEAGGVELIRTAYTSIVTITEIDSFQALASRNAATLSPQLRQLYSGEPLGFGYTDLSKRVIIPAHSYRACVIAGVQPGRGEVILADTEGGFAQRWLWLPATDPHAPDDRPADPAPLPWRAPDKVADLSEEGAPAAMGVCEAAVREIDAARLETLRDSGEDIESHSLYTRLKVAAGLALLAGRADVSEADWELSGFLMRVSDATRDGVLELLKEKAADENRQRGRAEGIRADVAAEIAASQRAGRISRNVLRHVPRDSWVSENKLSHKISAADRSDVPDVLSGLLDKGLIESMETTYQGQAGTSYRSVR